MNFSENGNTLLCTFVGRLDGNVCSAIEQDLVHRITHFKANREDVRLIFDLSDVVYVSSAFLRICLMYLKSVGKNSFAVVNVSEEILKVFHITGFAEIMEVHASHR
jgi:anti-anti-sigma factor